MKISNSIAVDIEQGFEGCFALLESIARISKKSVNKLINEAVKCYVEEVPHLRDATTKQTKAINMLIDKFANDKPIKIEANAMENVKPFEKITIENISFLRVPGGWVAMNETGLCFVPWSDEFEEE